MRSDTETTVPPAEARLRYRRLPGRGQRRSGTVSVRLFLGADHLLCVDSSGVTETYRRFYFADIQSVQIRKTDRSRVWSLLLAIFTMVPALIALGLTGAGATVLWSLAGVFLLFLLIHLVRGPTCVAQLRTAVHTEELPSLNRLRTAHKALSLLRARIEQAQGLLSSEQIAASLPPTAEGIGESPRQSSGQLAPSRGTSEPAPDSTYRGGIHRILFWLLLLDAGESVLVIFVRHVALALVSSLLAGVLGICVILALVRQQNSELNRLIKGLTWAAAGYLGINFLFGYIFLMSVSMRDPGAASDQWRLLELYAQLAPFDTPWYMALVVSDVVVSTGLGLAGSLALRQRPAGAEATVPGPIPPNPTPT